MTDPRLTEPDKTAELRRTLDWALAIRSDPKQSTLVLQLADAVVQSVTELLEAERFRQEQLDRFMGVTELGLLN